MRSPILLPASLVFEPTFEPRNRVKMSTARAIRMTMMMYSVMPCPFWSLSDLRTLVNISQNLRVTTAHRAPMRWELHSVCQDESQAIAAKVDCSPYLNQYNRIGSVTNNATQVCCGMRLSAR